MDSGCYQLMIQISSAIELQIGSLGLVHFEAGKYVYTGSAMKNLAKRIARHESSEKKLRWHIDYLLAHDRVELIGVRRHFSTQREECLYNTKLINKGASVPVRGFGSSDCRKCDAHLLRIPSQDFSFL